MSEEKKIPMDRTLADGETEQVFGGSGEYNQEYWPEEDPFDNQENDDCSVPDSDMRYFKRPRN